MSEANGAGVGERLRSAREAQGRSLDDISRQTRVPARHLVQIEEGRLEGLPAAPYSAGFVKSYARAVGLDPVALSQAFRADFDAAQRGAPHAVYEPYEPADPSRLPPRLLALVALAIAVLLAAGYAVWRSGVLTGDGPGARARLAANSDDAGNAAAPAARAPASAPPPAAPAAGGAVVLTARQPVWVKIAERGGPSLFLGVIEQGKAYQVPATAHDPVIRTGRAEAIDVTVGGRPVAPLGPPARTLSDVSLKADALLGRAAPGGAAEGPAPAAPPRPAPAAGRGTAPAGDVPAAFANTARP